MHKGRSPDEAERPQMSGPGSRRTLVAAIILAALLMSHPRHRWADLRHYLDDTLSPALSEVARPGTGEHVLPLPVQAMLALLRGHGVNSYRVSAKITADPLIYQRIVESAWPIRPDRTATWYITFATEALPASCRSLDRQDDVVLARCP
jgi:hypothetical protein